MLDMIRLLEMQHKLQVGPMGADPLEIEGEERAEFIRWNVLALTDELHEALGEVGWKPWATSRHVNEDAAAEELVDALHFFLNLALALAPRGSTIPMVGHTLVSKYVAKNAVNARRQAEGYDGVAGKCPKCKRDISATEVVDVRKVGDVTVATSTCPCGHVHGTETG